MTLITRYDPFRELVTLQDRLFDGFSQVSGKDQLAAGTFVPPVDIYEDEQNLVLKLVLAPSACPTPWTARTLPRATTKAF